MGKKKNKKNKVKYLQQPTQEKNFTPEQPREEAIIWDSTKYSRKPVIIPLETFEALNNTLVKMPPDNYNVFMSVSEYSMTEVTPEHPVHEPGSPTHLIIFCMKLIQTDQFNPLGVVQIDIKKDQTDQLVTVWKAFIQDLSILGVLVVATISPASQLFHSVLSKLTENPKLHLHKDPIIYAVWPYTEIIHIYDYQNLMEEFQDAFFNRVDLFFLTSPDISFGSDSDSLEYYSACWTDILLTMASDNINCVYTQDGLGPDISIFGSKFKHSYAKITRKGMVDTETKESTDRLMGLLYIYDKICHYNIDMSVSELREFYAKTEDFRMFLSSAKFRTLDTYTLADNPSLDSTQTEKSFGLEENEASDILKIISDSIDQDGENGDVKDEHHSPWDLSNSFGPSYYDFSSDQPAPPPIESKVAKIVQEYFYPEPKTYEKVINEVKGASTVQDSKETAESIKEYFNSLRKKHKKTAKGQEINSKVSEKNLIDVKGYLECLRDKFKKEAKEIKNALDSEVNYSKNDPYLLSNMYKTGTYDLQTKKSKSKPIKELLTQIEDAVKPEQQPKRPKNNNKTTNDLLITPYEAPKIFGHTCDCCEEDEVIVEDFYHKNGLDHTNKNSVKEGIVNGLPNGLNHVKDEHENSTVSLENGDSDQKLKQSVANNNCIGSKDCCMEHLITAEAKVTYGAIKNSNGNRVSEEESDEDAPPNIKDFVQNDLEELKVSIKTLEETEQALSDKLECRQLKSEKSKKKRKKETSLMVDETQLNGKEILEVVPEENALKDPDIICNGNLDCLSKSSDSVDSLMELFGALKEEEPALNLQEAAIPSKHQHAIPFKVKKDIFETDESKELSLSENESHKFNELPIEELQGLMNKVYGTRDSVKESKKCDREVEEINKRLNGTKRREVVAKIVRMTGQKVSDKDLKKYAYGRKHVAPTKLCLDDQIKADHNASSSAAVVTASNNATSLDFMEGIEKFYSTLEPEYLQNCQTEKNDAVAMCCRLPSTSSDSHFSLDSRERISLPHYTRFNRLSRSSSEDSLPKPFCEQKIEIRLPHGEKRKMKQLASSKISIRKRGRTTVSAINDVATLKTDDFSDSYEVIESSVVNCSSPKTDLTVKSAQQEPSNVEEVEVVEIDYSCYRNSLVSQLNTICDEKKSYCDNIIKDKTSVSKLFELFPQNCESLRVTTDWLCTLKGYSKLADVLEKRKLKRFRSKVLCLEHVSLYVALVKKLRKQLLNSLRDKTANSFLDFECSFNILLSMSGVYIVNDNKEREVEATIGQESRV